MRIFTILCAICSVAVALPAWSENIDVSKLQVSMLGDVEKSCGQLSAEASDMRDIIAQTQSTRDDASMTGKGISAAGAVGSLLLGTATGGIGLAAAGFMAHQANDEDDTKAEKVQDIAEQRRSFMVGIFNAKGCKGPIENVMQDPRLFDPAHQAMQIDPAASEPMPNRNIPHFNQ